MPEQLLGRIIRVSSNSNDLVLDPFAGSGTTLVVAKKLCRRWIGFELSENYAKQIRHRLATVSEGEALVGAEDPKVSAPSTAEGKRLGIQTSKSIPIVKPRVTKAEIHQGIVEAFIATRDGYSCDRVIADPELNKEFLSLCKRLGIPGQPKDWNKRLLNLRKASRLSGLPRPRRTLISEEEMDRCDFACEIAIQHYAESGRTLDSLLCDPAMATEFDALVRSMVKPDLPALLIRWVALRIRKGAHSIRKEGEALESLLRRPSKKDLASQLDCQVVPPFPGLYWLQSADEEKRLYVGKTRDLQQRLRLQIHETSFDFWGTPRPELEIRYLPADLEVLPGNQSCWIGKWKPQGNYSQLAAS